MTIDELRNYLSIGFTVAFWLWFAAFSLAAADLGWSALRHSRGDAEQDHGASRV
ncbi:MAG: hypothetical protein RIC55_10485 [Pirellulaceae bacterium]